MEQDQCDGAEVRNLHMIDELETAEDERETLTWPVRIYHWVRDCVMNLTNTIFQTGGSLLHGGVMRRLRCLIEGLSY